MKLIITSIIMFLLILIILMIAWKRKRETRPGMQEREWSELINNFKTVAPKIDDINQLERYLQSINDQVKKYESDYEFLVVFNSMIKKVRERLKRDD